MRQIALVVLALAIGLIVIVFAKAQQPTSAGVIRADSVPALGSHQEPAVMKADNPKGIGLVEEPRTPTIPDKLALQIRTEQLQQARDSAEFNQILATDIGKRLVELQKKLIESGGRLQTLSKGICGDEKLWALDPDALKCVPAPKPEAAKASPSPSP